MVTFDPVYVIGGRQRKPRGLTEGGDTWYGYGTGIILRVSPDGVETLVEYVSPPGVCQPDDPILFKSASRLGDTLYCSTQTEVVIYRLPDFEQIGHISIPAFNDVHHVVPYGDDSVLVANSGLECVMQVGLDGSILDEWNVLGEDTWSVFDRTVDYRQGIDLKPHRGHPNHLLVHDGEVWVSRFELRDFACLSDMDHPVELGGERIHDGIVHNGRAYVTMVDGHVAEIDLERRQRTALHSLHRPGDDRPLGWCRGLLFDDDRCWVGFSRIRPTKLRHTVQWVRGTAGAPTRIDLYDTATWSVIHSIDLEPAGLNAVFSIIPTGEGRPIDSRFIYG